MSEAGLAVSKTRLMKNTLLAALVAVGLLVLIILPAEYGIDPTGVGDVLGLKGLSVESSSRVIANPVVEQSVDTSTRFHTRLKEPPQFLVKTIELLPFGQIEYKFHMPEGAKLTYHWQSDGGMFYADLHGHTKQDGEEVVIQYLETMEDVKESGELVSAFDGEHGWYFLNLEDYNQSVTLKVSGQYREHELVDLGSQLDSYVQ